MVLGGLFGVVFRFDGVAVGQMGVVSGLLVVACFMVLRGGPVVPGGGLVMLVRLAVMFGALNRHGSPLSWSFRAQLLIQLFEDTRAG